MKMWTKIKCHVFYWPSVYVDTDNYFVHVFYGDDDNDVIFITNG